MDSKLAKVGAFVANVKDGAVDGSTDAVRATKQGWRDFVRGYKEQSAKNKAAAMEVKGYPYLAA